MNLYNTNYITIKLQGETKIKVYGENDDYEAVMIGSFDFYYMEGTFYHLNGKSQEVKRFSTIMNYLFKQNDMLFWDESLINEAKNNAKTIKIDEEKERVEEAKKSDDKKASDMINGIHNKEDKYVSICKSVENKSDEELSKLVVNTFKKASKKTLDLVFATIRQYNNGEIVYTQEVTEVNTVNDKNVEVVEVNTTNDNEPEVFYVGNNTFNTYSEAFNYTTQKGITTSMILSSKHPSMTNERLQQLEYSFVFDKVNMSYKDKKDYFNYLEDIPNSLDRENRYYKLKSWIERHEKQQQRQQEEKDRIYNLGLEASETLEYMVANGLEIKENESYVKYYLNGQDVHTWFSGISAEKYHEGIMNIYNRYFIRATS